MCITDGYREDAIDEIERVKNTGDLIKAQHIRQYETGDFSFVGGNG